MDYNKSSCLSKLFFCWALAYARRSRDPSSQMLAMPDDESSQALTARLEAQIRQHKHANPGKPISMHAIYSSTYRWPLFWANLLNCMA